MNPKIGLYFQLETVDSKASFSLIKLALNRLEQLEDEGIGVEYFELRLYEMSPFQKNKEAYIKLDGNERTFIDSATSSRSDDAFMTAFDRIHDRFRNLKKKDSSNVSLV